MTHLYKITGQDAVVYRTKSDLVKALRSLQDVGDLQDLEVEVYEEEVEGEPVETLHPNVVLREACLQDDWFG